VSRLPFPERVLHQHIATLGKTGAGKSSAMRVIAEHLLEKNRRVAIIDPKGDWWGLKSSADGKGAGYPVIMFGDFKEPRATDVPINDRSGKHVAELIATGNRPCVLGFRGWMPGQLTQFWLDFAPTLFNANEGELYVIIDEVHNFAPKGKIMDPQAGKCLHWTNRIMSEGRGLGLTFFIASQRPQKVHNDTLDNCETLIAMRVTHPRSRDASEEWINARGDAKFAKEVLESLANLKRGEAWVWSPENGFGPERVQFPMFQTFDSFAPPQLQKKVSQAGWSEVDLDQVKQKLATVIAEAKANDPKELKSEIVRLKQELAKKHHPAAPAKAAPMVDSLLIERAVKAATTPLLRQIETIRKQAKQTIDNFSRAIAPLNAIANLPAQEIPKIALPAPAPMIARTPVAISAPRVSRSSRESIAPANGEVRSRLALQIAGILAAYYPKPLKRSILASMCGVTYGGHFSNNLSELRGAGLLEDRGPGEVIGTEKCMHEYAGTFDPPTNTEEVIALWEQKLSLLARKILRKLVELGGEAITRNELAESLGVTYGGHFSNNLSELRGAGLIEDVGSGLVAPNREALFLSNHAA
jgi:uncharacterized protein